MVDMVLIVLRMSAQICAWHFLYLNIDLKILNYELKSYLWNFWNRELLKNSHDANRQRTDRADEAYLDSSCRLRHLSNTRTPWKLCCRHAPVSVFLSDDSRKPQGWRYSTLILREHFCSETHRCRTGTRAPDNRKQEFYLFLDDSADWHGRLLSKRQ